MVTGAFTNSVVLKIVYRYGHIAAIFAIGIALKDELAADPELQLATRIERWVPGQVADNRIDDQRSALDSPRLDPLGQIDRDRATGAAAHNDTGDHRPAADRCDRATCESQSIGSQAGTSVARASEQEAVEIEI